jgi:hypothetical protein
MRKLITVAVALMLPASATAATCGCVTPSLELWFDRSHVISAKGTYRLHYLARHSVNPSLYWWAANVVITTGRKVKDQTATQFKAWKKGCTTRRSCRTLLACLAAGTGTYFADLAFGDTEKKASWDASRACLSAAVGALIVA